MPLLPALRRQLVEWKLEAPHTDAGELVIGTADSKPVAERNLRRALDDAKTAAGLDGGDARLSWHSLRHSFASMLATEGEVQATTLARLTGHSDPGFTLRVYARDGRDDAALVKDVLARASRAGIGSCSGSATRSYAEGHGLVRFLVRSECRLRAFRAAEAPAGSA